VSTITSGMDDHLAHALGHLRLAAHQLLGRSDLSGQALLLAAQVLDLEELLRELEVEPTYVSVAASPASSLAAASKHLICAAPVVPSSVWPTLQNLLHQVGHGDR
jgi:hypothetical protein